MLKGVVLSWGTIQPVYPKFFKSLILFIFQLACENLQLQIDDNTNNYVSSCQNLNYNIEKLKNTNSRYQMQLETKARENENLQTKFEEQEVCR